jgi:hypothetical protein
MEITVDSLFSLAAFVAMMAILVAVPEPAKSLSEKVRQLRRAA